MSKPVIVVDKLSKSYRIGHKAEKYPTFRDAMVGAVKAPLQRLWGLSSGAAMTTSETFWALKDVSFEVQKGEVVGIIGRNGAGKSTLLKVLSRITEPTSGCVRMRGRVASLLEVGTGFHPELTGRENIYMNGAILGMRREEIKRKFDEIVAFAEVEKFLDTPVKFYSSGMYVRLAFAVAAHLEPEILIVDEVLAVGDAEFQKKCLGKMKEVSQGQGRTVLFVSHNMAAVESLCSRGVLLELGGLLADNCSRQITNQYLRALEKMASTPVGNRSTRGGSGGTRLVGFEMISNGSSSLSIVTGNKALFKFALDSIPSDLQLIFAIYDTYGKLIADFNSHHVSNSDIRTETGGRIITCEVEELLLVPGTYRVNVALIRGGELQDHVEAATIFDVREGIVRGRPVSSNARGAVIVPHHWCIQA